MDMAVGDTTDRLTRQPRQIIIFDLIGLRVEEIEHVELEPHAIVEFITHPRVEDQRLQRTHAVVFNQRTRPEITRPQGAKPAGVTAEDYAPTRHQRRRASVVPASPTNSNSESKSSTKTANELVRPSIVLVRIPISAPRDRTSNGTRSSGVTLSLGSTVIVAPLISLECRP